MMRLHGLLEPKLPIVLLSSVIFAAACADGTGPVAPAVPEVSPAAVSAGAGQVDSDGWIVVFKPGVADPPGLARQLVDRHGGSIRFVYRYAIQGFGGSIPAQAIQGISKNPNVAFVERDAEMMVDGDQTDPPSWGLDRIDEADLPRDGVYHYDFDGTDVNAYIIDTGIRTSHNDFGGRAAPGFDAIDGTPDGNDCHGHGTHVAGTVGGSSYGVAKGVNLIAVRVLGCSGSGSTAGVIAGVDWVKQQHQGGSLPSVANMSLGGGASTALDQAVASAVAAGVTFAVSAGNSSTSACTQSPAREPSALTIGSTTSSDARSSFSNYGSCLDIFAPGSSITSAWGTGDDATNTISGTSMASPHVAGAAALVLDEDPGRTPAQVASVLDARATQGALSSIGSGSPNKLLCSLADCTEGGGGGGGPVVVKVSSVSAVSLSGRKHKQGTVDVAVLDAATGLPVAGAVTATVDWFKNGESSTAKTTSGVTQGGVATVSSGTIKGASTLEACVTSLSGTGVSDGTDYAVDPVCSDGGGSGGGGGGGGGEETPPSGLAANVKNGRPRVQLSWTTGSASSVDIYRDGPKVTTTGNGGSYTDSGDHAGSTYRVCIAGAEVNDANCTNPAIAN